MVQTVFYDDFIEGRNPYLLAGYENHKKYYGSDVHAVEENGQIIQIFEMGWGDEGVEFNSSPELWEKKVIDPSRFEALAENGTMFPKDY